MSNGLPQVQIFQQNGGFGRGRGNEDGICGLITAVPAAAIPTVASTPTYVLGTTLKLTSLRQAEATYGFDENYDTANGVVVWHNIREFFRLGGGTLYIMLVDDSLAASQDALVDVANVNFASKLLNDANGEIRCLGVAYNTASPTAGSSMALMTENAIAKAQDLADQEWGLKRPVDVILEGINFQATPATADDLHTTYAAKDVSVVIAQDRVVASKHANFMHYASVGTALGLYAIRNVHESIGWVEYGNIADQANNIFTNPLVSGNTPITAFTPADLDDLDNKGYIFPRTFNTYNGVYLNDDHTCESAAGDFIYIALNRAIKKAARVAYQTLVPHLNRPVQIGTNGRLLVGERKMFEGDIKAALQAAMAGQITNIGQVMVDPEFDENNVAYPSFNTDPTLRVLLSIVPYGKVEQIQVYLGFTLNQLTN